MTLWLLLPTLVLVAWILTGQLRRYALAKNIIDVPNARSSHSIPTPRGGGVAIVLSYLLTIPLLATFDIIGWRECWAVLGAGGAVAVLGFLDDHGHIAARWRLLGHFSAAAWVLYFVGGMPPLIIFNFDLELGWVGHCLGVFYIVWLLNLYNFMDGIDGLAGVEAVFVCAGGALLYVLLGYPQNIWILLTLGSTVLGFLIWNLPPARIFMGDAGSGFLGISLAALTLQAAWVNPVLLPAWLILLGVFVVDATLTLIRRLLRGEKVYEAHRSHAYQFASRHYGSHLPVTVAVLLINLLWLLPLAVAVSLNLIEGWIGLIIAYVPLGVLAIRFQAGQAETSHADSLKR